MPGSGVVDVNRHNLVARRHAIAQMGGGKIECVMEYLHLVFNLGLLVGLLVDGLLYIVVEIAKRYGP